jgi:HTH-type transcriptional regulator / antitoxin HigA
MSVLTEDFQYHWSMIGPLFMIRNEHDYDQAVKQLNDLLDEIGTNEQHPLYGLMDTLSTLLHDYEEQHHSLPEISGADMLRFFMEEHELSEIDLPEVGPRNAVSEILSGERELNVQQIRDLAQRFRVSPAVFI